MWNEFLKPLSRSVKSQLWLDLPPGQFQGRVCLQRAVSLVIAPFTLNPFPGIIVFAAHQLIDDGIQTGLYPVYLPVSAPRGNLWREIEAY